MQKQQGRGHAQKGKKPFTFRAHVDGHRGTFTAESLKSWKTHSGSALDGTQVHSLDTSQIGDTTVVRRPDGSMKAYRTADLQVFAIDLLIDAGCAVMHNGKTLGA